MRTPVAPALVAVAAAVAVKVRAPRTVPPADVRMVAPVKVMLPAAVMGGP